MIRFGGIVAEKSVLKHLTVYSDRKRIKYVHQSATQRFVIGPQRLFEQLLNSSATVPIVFKQTASHLPHEANSEQLFSRSGSLSDDNGKMDPAQLAVWTSIGVNYSIYKPTDKQILERYMLKFSKGGKATVAEMHIDDLGLLDPEAEGEAEGGEA